MAKRTVYFDNCIKEIRESVYGRDNRKPIADVIAELKGVLDREKTVISFRPLSKVEVVIEDENHIDWWEIVAHTITSYDTLAGNTSDAGLSTSLIEDSDYLLMDDRGDDFTDLISDDDYLLTAVDSNWTASEFETGSHDQYEFVPHYENYILVVNP